MDPRQSKQGICNQHGIRIYPVPVHGKYKIEIEFNKSAGWERRYQTKEPIRGSKYYATDKKEWAVKIQELYQELYETKVLPKLKRNEKKLLEKPVKNEVNHLYTEDEAGEYVVNIANAQPSEITDEDLMIQNSNRPHVEFYKKSSDVPNLD